MRALAIDFETANERRDSACAVGLAWIRDGAVARREYRLIRPPEMRFSPGNVRIHGLTAADVRHAGCFATVMREFRADLEGEVVLAHNASFDLSVIAHSSWTAGFPVPRIRYGCTLEISRRVWPEHRGHKLSDVAGRLGIEFRHHHAGDDAAVCAMIALAAAERLGARGIDEVATVTTWGESPPGRAAPSRRSARPLGEARYRFVVRGSTGNEYQVRAREEAGRYEPSCTCMGWTMRRRCKHVEALHCGDISNLLSGNHDEVGRFVALVARA